MIQHATHRRFRPSALSCALSCAIGAAVAAPAVLAQDAPQASSNQQISQGSPPAQNAQQAQAGQATELDTVQVVGIRASVQSSIQTKRDATVISDALSAKDIGDLPALSIGEAIETITGASTHREKGGATEISVRGLGPFLGSATFNGREATNGSGDRSVNFNQFPSELINTVQIYKTQQADFIEGGIAGTINMATVKPLSFGERRIQLEGRATYPEYDGKLNDSDGIGWRGTASYLDQFEFANGGKLGLSLGVQSMEGSNPEEVAATSSTWTACDATVEPSDSNCTAIEPGGDNAGNPFFLMPNGRLYRQLVEHDKRDAAFAAVQWQPNDTMEVNFDYQWSDRVFSEDRNELNLPDGRRAIDNVVADATGAVESFTGQSGIETNSDYKVRAEEYEGAGLNFQWRPSAAWLFSTDLAYSHTLRTENDWVTRLRADDEDINGDPVPGIQGSRYIDYSYDYDGDVPSLIIDPDFDITRWENFSDVPRVRRDEQLREHTLRAFRFDGSYFPEAGFLTAVKAGVRYAESEYGDYDDRVEINADRDLVRAANEACRTGFPQDDFLDEASGNTIDRWATFDSRCLFRMLTGVDDTGPSDDLRNPANSDVEEETRAVYLMGEFASEWFSLPVTGNFGVRWVSTDVRSTGLRSELTVVENDDGTVRLASTGEFGPSTVIEASHDTLLPSFNAALELSQDKVLRLGVYRAMTRPDMSALSAGRTIDTGDEDDGYDNVEEAIQEGITVSGNPRAEPLMSWNADVSWEWYPNPDSMLSAAIYYKQFTGGDIPVVIDETFIIDGEPVVVPVQQDTTTDEKSDLVGLELTGMHRFSYLPAPFDGLGVKMSYNYADSNFENHDLRLGDQIDPETGEITPGLVEPANIFGLSKHVASGSLYWTLGPVDLQAIYKYRSEYYQRFVGAPSQNRYIEGGSTVDFRATWRVDDHLSFSLEASNLTDEPRISYMPVTGNFHEYHGYGRRYYLGVRYRF